MVRYCLGIHCAFLLQAWYCIPVIIAIFVLFSMFLIFQLGSRMIRTLSNLVSIAEIQVQYPQKVLQKNYSQENKISLRSRG